MAKPAPTAHAQFTASIPENYDRYLGPVIFEPYAKDLAQRLGKTDPKNVLETACGTGIVTRRLLEALSPDAGLIATDLNPAMLDHARAAIGDDSRVSWEVSDMCDLNFESETFDAVVATAEHAFAAFVDAVAPWRSSATPAACPTVSGSCGSSTQATRSSSAGSSGRPT